MINFSVWRCKCYCLLVYLFRVMSLACVFALNYLHAAWLTASVKFD